MNAKFRNGKVDTGTEWFLYQTMVGAWPIDAERLRKYMQKAMREAKLHTSWVANNEEYEKAVNAYIDAIAGRCRISLPTWSSLSAEIARRGRVNSLAQTLMKHTAPGCPTSTRAASFGTFRWSTRTIAGLWTTSCAASCWLKMADARRGAGDGAHG